jgi:hypothetical protein
MWLNDLERAIKQMREQMIDFCFINLENVHPAADGSIVFKTTHHTYIKVFRDGTIIERGEGEWRNG